MASSKAVQKFTANPSLETFWQFCIEFADGVKKKKITEWPADLYYRDEVVEPTSFWGLVSRIAGMIVYRFEGISYDFSTFSSIRDSDGKITRDADLACALSNDWKTPQPCSGDYEADPKKGFNVPLSIAAVCSKKCIFLLSQDAFEDPRFVAAILLASINNLRSCYAFSDPDLGPGAEMLKPAALRQTRITRLPLEVKQLRLLILDNVDLLEWSVLDSQTVNRLDRKKVLALTIADLKRTSSEPEYTLKGRWQTD